MVEKLLAMNSISKCVGMPNMRIMTDLGLNNTGPSSGKWRWRSLDAFEKMMSAPPASEADQKEFEKVMSGYHDLVDSGRREIYKLEG